MKKEGEEARRQQIDPVYVVMFIFVIGLAFSTRVYVSFFSGLPWFITDTYSYFQMADGILAGHPYSSFPNGYPILIAIAKSISKPEEVATVLIALNIVLSTLVVGMTTEMSKKMMGIGLATCMAGFGIALYPNQLNFTRQLLTEVPTTFLLTLSVFLFLRRKYFVSGLAFCLAVLFRSSLLPALPILFVCSLLHPNARVTKRQGVTYLGGFGIGVALYSILLVAGIVKPSENLDSNLLISISSYSSNMNYSAGERFTSEEKQHPLRTYFKFALDNPKEYMKQRISSLQELWGWPASGNPPRSFLTKVLIAVRFPFLILAILGFYRRIHDFDAWVLFIPVVAVTLVHVATFSTSRFTFVVEPFVVILATTVLGREPRKYRESLM